ncbi:MAG: TIM barrel protein [Pseudomonadales bacterium]|nr:TIM barrel protein [Pseudomonadales bacterium]
MPKFAANLTTMFAELPFPERFAAASDCGFRAVEILAPYPFETKDLETWLKVNDLQLLLINISPGPSGETGLAALPGRELEFRASFEQALHYTTYLGAGMIHVLAGKNADGVTASVDTFVDNLKWAARLAGESNINLMLEPLNNVDVPGYLHSHLETTRGLVEAVGHDNVRLQFDFYHQQIMEGNLARNLEANLDIIGHAQFSSVPGRHEPQYGEVNVPYLCDLLDELGYDGYIGCEYSAKSDTRAGLSWAHRYGICA